MSANQKVLSMQEMQKVLSMQEMMNRMGEATKKNATAKFPTGWEKKKATEETLEEIRAIARDYIEVPGPKHSMLLDVLLHLSESRETEQRMQLQGVLSVYISCLSRLDRNVGEQEKVLFALYVIHCAPPWTAHECVTMIAGLDETFHRDITILQKCSGGGPGPAAQGRVKNKIRSFIIGKIYLEAAELAKILTLDRDGMIYHSGESVRRAVSAFAEDGWQGFVRRAAGFHEDGSALFQLSAEEQNAPFDHKQSIYCREWGKIESLDEYKKAILGRLCNNDPELLRLLQEILKPFSIYFTPYHVNVVLVVGTGYSKAIWKCQEFKKTHENCTVGRGREDDEMVLSCDDETWKELIQILENFTVEMVEPLARYTAPEEERRELGVYKNKDTHEICIDGRYFDGRVSIAERVWSPAKRRSFDEDPRFYGYIQIG